MYPVDSGKPLILSDIPGVRDVISEKEGYIVEPLDPKSIAEALAEAKEYKAIKRKDDMSSNQESGTKAYLISRKWIKSYEKYVLFEEFNYGYNESRI